MPNVALLEETLDYILVHPEEHDQGVWIEQTECGTTRCFAGTAVMLTGYRLCIGSNASCLVPANDELGYPVGDGRWIAPIQEVAIRELGLNIQQALQLFNCQRTIDDLQLAVKDIVNEQLVSV